MGLADTRDPNSLSTKLRRRRDVRLRAVISSISRSEGGISILDMGGTFEYWQRVGLDFLRGERARITLINRFATELSEFAGHEDIFSAAVGDACDLAQFGDKSFDLAHSNSVIEHVETWKNMKAFAAETRRVAKYYYVQTPYFWFPLDPHYYRMPFFHWFPRPTRAWMLRNFPIAYSGKIQGVDLAFDVVDRARLLDGAQFHFLFPDAKTTFEHVLGLRKSLIAIHMPNECSTTDAA
ncbi:methyltransferase domain-containing protein [Phenylobacterium sp. Root700]|uniref:methyltransferase domain-containing protein n=1 Tax=Phenylobacterium sp. Root700 TaxID=1736591 RepID=UPI0009E997AB|nr:methyltransferase domain-containing protein [Phenylobacterium sp. Root700]